MTIDELKKHKRILIVGYGREGRATEEFLKQFVPESSILIADQKDGEGYLEKQESADLVIKSPGVRPELIKKPYTTPTNIFFANTQNKVIGVTGSKGKSTTASMIHAILIEAGQKSFLVGNIGTPAIEELLQKHSDDDIYVMELSSYQLADIHYSPHIAVFLNFYTDHAYFHGSVDSYFSAKANIVRFSNRSDFFVYNPHVSEIAGLLKKTAAQPVPFVELLADISHPSLKGKHNEENIRAAVAVASILHISETIIKKAVHDFAALPHRMEEIGVFNEIAFVDDGAATTPESTIFALSSIPDVQTLLVGGEDRDQDFSKLAEEIGKSGVEVIIAFPDTGVKIISEIKKRRIQIQFFEARSMKDAVKYAFENTSPGKTVLLSSASPSYSLWKSFDEKGDEFKKYIKEHAPQTS